MNWIEFRLEIAIRIFHFPTRLAQLDSGLNYQVITILSEKRDMEIKQFFDIFCSCVKLKAL